MFGYWKKLKELEEQNRDLNGRLKELEQQIYRIKANELLEKLSEKYGIKIELKHNLFNRRYYLVSEDDKTICLLECFDGMTDVYLEIERCEAKIKAFMYDKIKDAVVAAEKEGEETNDKE